MKFLPFACLSLLLCGGTAGAQVSYPNLLDSQFDGPDSETALHLSLFQPFRSPTASAGLSWESRDELTVHTNKGQKGLQEDLHANGSVFSLRLPLGRSAHPSKLILRNQVLETGGVENENDTALRFRGHFRRPEIQVLWPLAHNVLAYVGYRRTDYEVDGTTRLYKDLFTIFPNTPPFRYEGRERLALAGLQCPVSLAWTLEAVLGRQDEPTRLTLHQDGVPAEVVLPLGDAGMTSLLAARRQLPHGAALFVYVGGERLSGTGTVQREGNRDIGEAATTHDESSWGLGWQHPFGGSRRLGVFWEAANDHWETHGTIPDPADLQTRYGFTSNLHYAARYAATKRAFGVIWNQNYRAGQTMHGNLQWLNVGLHADADYDVRYFGFPKGGQASYSQDSFHAFLLRGQYSFPWNRLRVGLDVSQLLPLGAARNSATNSSRSISTGPPDPNRTVTTGGWAINVRFERPF